LDVCGRSCTKVRVQVQCASTVFSTTWIRSQRTLSLLVSAIYARLRNAQRTWFRSSSRCGKSLHCMFLRRSDGSLPKFPFSVWAADLGAMANAQKFRLDLCVSPDNGALPAVQAADSYERSLCLVNRPHSFFIHPATIHFDFRERSFYLTKIRGR
jgi:hypothetical protein